MTPYGLSPVLAQDLVNALTPRQRQVAERIALGEERADIAEDLKIAVKTLDIHITAIKEKWNCKVHGVGRIWFAQFADEGKS